MSASLRAPNVETCSPELAPRCQLEILEVDRVKIQFPTLSEPADLGKKISPAQEIYQTFNNGEKMILALRVLANISSATAIPSTNVPRMTLSAVMESPTRMLVASRLAQTFLEDSDLHPGTLRLQLLMSYITLYLTIEYSIVPQMKHKYPSWGAKRIAGRK